MRVLRWLDNAALLAGLGYLAAFAVWPRWFSGKSHTEDPMALSGFVAVFATVVVARVIQDRFAGNVRRLLRSGTLHSTDNGGAFFARFERITVRSVWSTAAVFVVLTVTGILLADSNPDGKLHLALGSAIGAWLLGVRFGWSIATGIASAMLNRSGVQVVLTKNAVDGSGGLRSLGEYYFRQAAIIFIPAAGILFWLWAIDQQFAFTDPYWKCLKPVPLGTPCPSEHVETLWTDQFLRLLGFFFIVVFNGCVLVPTFFLRRLMAQYKADHFEPMIPVLEAQLQQLRAQARQSSLVGAASHALASARGLHNAIRNTAEELAAYRDAPVWPMPLWGTLLSIASNLSALVGLVTVFNFGAV